MVEFAVNIRGLACRLIVEDKGDTLPWFDVDGRMFLAWTTYFRIHVPPEFAPPDKYPILEMYSQTQQALAPETQSVEDFRRAEDGASLDGMLDELNPSDAERAAIFALVTLPQPRGFV